MPSEPTAPSVPQQHPGNISPVFVFSMICLTAILTLGMVSLVFYRSQSIIEPTAAAVLVGDPSLDGAEINVLDGEKLIAKVDLNADNQFTTPILLQPGLYRMQVSIRGKMLLDDRFNAQALRYATFALPTALVVEGDSSLGGAVVQVTSNREEATSTVLDADNGYTAISYHMPGTFNIVVAHEGRIIRTESVTLAAHKPRRISLLSPIDATHFFDQNQ
jgi:hypothetical protein